MPVENAQKLLAIDAYSLFYKTFFALQNHPLSNSKGTETTVVFSVLNVLHSLLKMKDFTHLVFAMESRTTTRRKTKYADYKATRSPMPESLGKQIDLSLEALKTLGIPVLSFDGYEADDVLASLALEGKKRGIDVTLYTSDKDLTQVVSEGIILAGSSRQGVIETTDETGVLNKWGVPPKKMLDLLSLIGDTSDNIPGVAGVGPKTAVKLLETFETLEGIYEHLDEVKPEGLKAKLIADKDKVFFGRELIRLEMVPSINFEELTFKAVEKDAVMELMNTLEMPAIVKKYGFLQAGKTLRLDDFKRQKKQSEEPLQETSTKAWQLKGAINEVKTKEDVENLCKLIRSKKHLIFDFETTSLDPFSAEIVSISVGFKDSDELYFVLISEAKPSTLDLFHTHELKPNAQVSFKDHPLAAILCDEGLEKIGHNLKYEMMICSAHGLSLRGKLTDTMLREFLINSSEMSYKLERLILKHFGEVKITYDELVGKGELGDVSKEKLIDYALSDVEATKRLYLLQETRFDETLKNLYETMDEPLIEVLASMEMTGVVIDAKKLAVLSQSFAKRIEDLSKNIYTLSGEVFNLNSPKQLAEVLFEKLRIPHLKKTKTGYSTDTFVLEKLSRDYPICLLIVEYRSLQKLLGTYIDALPKMVHPKTGRIHTNYNQTVASTGRLSSSNPNLQNIPIKNHEGRLIREAFVAPKGQKFISIDYSQVELRVLAQLSQEPNLLNAFKEHRDIHQETAKYLFSVETPNEDQRRIGKTINFSALYGVSAFALSESLKIPFADAKRFIDHYFATYAKVRSYMEGILEEVRTSGAATTFYGRRRPIEGMNSSNKNLRERAERMAFNSVIQGTASDIIKKAMIKIHENIVKKEIEAEMVMQVHDELVFYINESPRLEKDVEKIKKIMTDIAPFENLLEVKAEVSDFWT